MNFSLLDVRPIIAVFHGVSDDDYARLSPLLRRVRCRAGKTLLRVGGNIGKVFFVLRGEVQIIGEDADGERVVNVCGMGTTLGEINAVDGGNHSATVVTVSECELLWMSSDDFARCVQTIPMIGFNGMVMLAARARRLTAQTMALSSLEATERICHFLGEIATRFCTDPNKKLPLTQVQLMGMAGCSRTQLRRVLDELVRDGLVERTRSSLRVLDVEAMRSWSLRRKRGEKVLTKN